MHCRCVHWMATAAWTRNTHGISSCSSSTCLHIQACWWRAVLTTSTTGTRRCPSTRPHRPTTAPAASLSMPPRQTPQPSLKPPPAGNFHLSRKIVLYMRRTRHRRRRRWCGIAEWIHSEFIEPRADGYGGESAMAEVYPWRCEQKSG